MPFKFFWCTRPEKCLLKKKIDSHFGQAHVIAHARMSAPVDAETAKCWELHKKGSITYGALEGASFLQQVAEKLEAHKEKVNSAAVEAQKVQVFLKELDDYVRMPDAYGLRKEMLFWNTNTETIKKENWHNTRPSA